MFSGDSRYVSKSWAAKLTESELVPGHSMTLPPADDTRRSLYRDINHAKERAAREADEIIPESVDEGCNRDLRNILEDRHILEVLAMYSVQPALYRQLVEATFCFWFLKESLEGVIGSNGEKNTAKNHYS